MLTAKLIQTLTEEDLENAAQCLEYNANPNALNNDGATAMHIAAGVGIEAVRLLLAHGGDPNVRSVDGSTPLHVAAAWGNRDILQLLLHNGANPNLTDQDGQRAVDVAQCEGHSACVDFLKYYSMLVAIGDEEESPKYTAEPLDDKLVTWKQSPTPEAEVRPHTSSLSSDDDDSNLSSEYSEALSRRLTRLLRQGESACLDVTSPNCPYIASKYAPCISEGDRTVLAYEHARSLVESPESDISETSSVGCEPQKHCSCCHWEDAETRTRCHTCQLSHIHSSCHALREQHCACSCKKGLTTGSPDPEMRYAENVERRMRQKYFPDLERAEGLRTDVRTRCQCSRSPTEAFLCTESADVKQGREREQMRFPSPGCSSCGAHGTVYRSTSPRLFSAIASPPTSRRSPVSPSTRCSAHVYRHHSASPPLHRHTHHNFSRPLSPSHFSACSTRSPLRICPSSRGQVDHSSRKVRDFKSPPSWHERPFGLSLSCNRSPVAHQTPLDIKPQRQAQADMHSSGLESIGSEKRSPYHPSPKSKQLLHDSSGTVMPVLSCAYPPAHAFKFAHGTSEMPFTDLSPSKKQPKCTGARTVAGSHSSNSVDSGYCENTCAGSSKELRAKSGVMSPKFNQENILFKSDMTAYTAASKGKMPDQQMVSENSPVKDQAFRKMTFALKSSEQSPVDSNPFEIIAGNIKSPVKMLKSGSVSEHKTACFSGLNDPNEGVPSETSVQAAAPKVKHEINSELGFDASRSSADSFQTCEEASSPGVDADSDVTIEHYSDSQHSSQTLHVSQNTREALYFVDKGSHYPAAARCVTANQFQKRKGQIRESLGLAESPEKQRLDDIRNVSAGGDMKQDGKPCISFTVGKPFELHPDKDKTADQTASQSRSKMWLPPSGPLKDDSDLLTSDGSFVSRFEKHPPGKTKISEWIKTLSFQPCTKSADPSGCEKKHGRLSDESAVSTSSLREFIYKDRENGITLLERHIPSDYDGSCGRSSIESVFSVDSQETVPYDWREVQEDRREASKKTPEASLDLTAGHTLALETDDSAENDDSDDKDWEFVVESDGDWSSTEDELRQKNGQKKQPGKAPSVKATVGGKDSHTVAKKTGGGASETPPTAVPPELQKLSDEAIFRSLKDLGEDPGPVLPCTRQAYLVRLASLQSGEAKVAVSTTTPGYSSELNRMVSGSLDMEELAKMEPSMVAQFQIPDGRTWREGTIKSCFNYLLLDPRVTKNLPLRSKSLSDQESFKTFLAAIFYIGKGKRSRPYCHLYEAISQLKSPKMKVSKKVQQILDIWSSGEGVVSLHCFQNVIPVEAYTREACMVDAIGLGKLTNVKRGDYYGVASTWPATRKRAMGAYLLRKAFQIFLSEGERQICPLDIQKGK